MNKFLDLLSRGRKSSHSPIGFGSTLTSNHQRQLLLVASGSNVTTKSQSVLKCKADALLFDESILTTLPALTNQLSDRTWGIQLSKQNDDELIKLNDHQADFLVVQQSTRINGHQPSPNTGIFLDVLPNLSEPFARALDGLPIDGVTLRGFQNQPLTFDSLLAIASLRTICDKYILVELQDSLNSNELNALCDIGIDGILVDTEISSINSMRLTPKSFNFFTSSKMWSADRRK